MSAVPAASHSGAHVTKCTAVFAASGGRGRAALLLIECRERCAMVSAQIVAAFDDFPKCGIQRVTELLQQGAEESPPCSPGGSRKKDRNGGRRSPSWPMPRSMFIVEEKRVAPDKQVYPFDAFIDHFGQEEGCTKWGAAEKFTNKSEETCLRTAVQCLKAGRRALLHAVYHC